MKATGVVRKIDELGRIVLPIELRRNMGINIRDSVEIFVDEDCIVLKKYQPCCVFCGEMNDVVNHMGKNVCKSCIEQLSNK